MTYVMQYAYIFRRCQCTVIRTGGLQAPFPNRHIDCWADNCGCISMGGYICTHTRGKYAHTHMNVSLVSAHVHVNAVGACTLVQRKTCCGP